MFCCEFCEISKSIFFAEYLWVTAPAFLFSGVLFSYFIMMIIEGIPLFYIKFAVDQRFRQSGIGSWEKMHPALKYWKWIGVSCVIISGMLCIYYVAVITWRFLYLFVSFTTTLPWSPEKCSGYGSYWSLTFFQINSMQGMQGIRNFRPYMEKSMFWHALHSVS